MTTALEKCLRPLMKRGLLNSEETDALAARLSDELGDRIGDLSKQDVLNVMDKIFNDNRLRNMKERQAEANSMRIMQDFDALWKEVRETEPFKNGKLSFVEFMSAALVGAGERFRGARNSVWAKGKGLEGGKRGALTQTWEQISLDSGLERDHVLSVLSSPKMYADQLDFLSEVMLPGSTRNKMMADAAKALSSITEDLRVRVNRAGGDVGKLEGYSLPQSHDPYKLAKTGFDEWYKFVSERIDWERTLPGAKTAEARKRSLGIIFRSLELNRDLHFHHVERVHPTAIGESQHRVIHFKDAGAFLDYHNKFGMGSLSHSIERHIRQSAQRVALMESLGTRPEAMVGKLIDNEKTRLRTIQEDMSVSEQARKKAKRDLKSLENAYNTKFKNSPAGEIANQMKEIMGETSSPVNVLAALIGNAIRNVKGLISMGLAGISTISDGVFLNAMLRAWGVEYGAGLKKYLQVSD